MNKQDALISIRCCSPTMLTIPCTCDLDTGIISGFDHAILPQMLDGCVVTVHGKRYPLKHNEHGQPALVRTYGVFFSRNGYAEISAASAEEAMRLANESMRYEDVSWDDDWSVTDVQLEDDE